MTEDLRRSLTELADAALTEAASADVLHRTAAERVRSRRRWRPAVVAGGVVAALALTGTGAYAALRLLDDDAPRHAAPDVLVTREAVPTTEAPASPSEPSTEPEEETPASPVAVGTMTCGALLDLPVDAEVALGRPWSEEDLGSTVEVQTWNRTGDDLRGEGAPPTTFAVKDGVVVGAAGTGAPVPALDLPGYGVGDGVTAPVVTTACDGSGPLPEGRYSVWASQVLTVTERTPRDETGAAGATVSTHETVAVLGTLGDLWLDGSGTPVPRPPLAAGWPVALTEVEAFRGDETEPENVVWLAAGPARFADDTLATVQANERLLDLGYPAGQVPYRCQPDALTYQPWATGAGDPMSWGVAVMFASADDAARFVSLWEPLHGPVLAQVTSSVGCDFS